MEQHIALEPRHFVWVPRGEVLSLRVTCQPLGQLVWLFRPTHETALSALLGAIEQYMEAAGGLPAGGFPPLEVLIVPVEVHR